ncbi:MAG: LysM peptidoglycan-binding domain-containing protein [Xanthomonadales bacterium]|nr:LysM peptidoglycan-binding domain-containing protein [Xanthomonadales bacterium]
MRPPRPPGLRLLLGAGVLLLAACAAPQKRPAEAPPVPAPTLPPPVHAPAPAAAVKPAPEASPWQRLRTRFEFDACSYRPEVQRIARNYASHPATFTRSWREAMPFFLLVLEEIERRDLPGEFALLPYVESRYRPEAALGNRPGGMWQLMPATARAAGLRIDASFDQRLDALEATAVALDLIERYERMFADWRVADLAFNTGEFRMQKLLSGREASTLSAGELAKLHPLAQQHLDRLLALACIIAAPERFGVDLPEPEIGDHLAVVPLEAGMDLRLAARLAGVSRADMQRWNAAFRRDRMPSEVAYRLLMPEIVAARFRDAVADIPRPLWADWHEERASRSGTIGDWAAEHGIDIGVLAAANGVDPDERILHNTRLLLPGATAEPALAQAREALPDIHVVSPGDTLWRIARRYSMPLERLRRLNPRMQATLRPGDRIRVGIGRNE